MIFAAETTPWVVQLGLAAPFVTALAFMGKWLIGRVEKAETEKAQLYEKLINEVVPALKSSTDQGAALLEQQVALAKDRASFVTKQEALLVLEQELIEKQDDLHKRELALARLQRRGGG